MLQPRIVNLERETLFLLRNWKCTALTSLAPHHTLCPASTRSFSTITPTHRVDQINRHLHSNGSTPFGMTSLPISERGYHPNAPSSYSVRKLGAPNTLDHRIFIEKDGVPVSPFHDIPLYANEQQTVLNMIVEIPRWTNAKIEVRLEKAKLRLEFCFNVHTNRSRRRSH